MSDPKVQSEIWQGKAFCVEDVEDSLWLLRGDPAGADVERRLQTAVGSEVIGREVDLVESCRPHLWLLNLYK